VNIAARVCAAAGPGELLVTETVRGLVRTSMPLAMEPRGRRHLKGIREPIGLFAIRPTGVASPSRARRLGAVAVRTLRRTPLAGGFAALVGVAIVATVVLAIGLLTNTNAEPDAGRLPVASGSGKPTPSASEDSAFPNAAERALLARIDPAIARLCDRAATSDYPRVHRGGDELVAVPLRAGLRCALGGSQPDVVFLWQMAPRQDLSHSATVFFQRVALLKAQLGDCTKDEKAYMDWSFGLLAGKLLCVASPTGARIDWTFGTEDLIATAERDDGDRAALYRWWLETGRVILH
jgi:hypothetical protein